MKFNMVLILAIVFSYHLNMCVCKTENAGKQRDFQHIFSYYIILQVSLLGFLYKNRAVSFKIISQHKDFQLVVNIFQIKGLYHFKKSKMYVFLHKRGLKMQNVHFFFRIILRLDNIFFKKNNENYLGEPWDFNSLIKLN